MICCPRILQLLVVLKKAKFSNSVSLCLFSSCALCLSGAHRCIPSSSRTSNPGRGAKKRQRRSIWRAHGNTVSHCACCLLYHTDPAVCVATAFPQLHAPPPLLIALLLPSVLFPDPLITLSHQTDTHSFAQSVTCEVLVQRFSV